MLVLPDGRGRQSYNGSIIIAPALGSKTAAPPGWPLTMAALAGWPPVDMTAGSGSVEHRVDCRAGLGDAVVKLRHRVRDVGVATYGGFELFGGFSDTESADRPGRTFERMRQRGRIGRQSGKRTDQATGLPREHRQHLPLKADIAKRHALKMGGIDRTIVRGKRWRWHPVNPFQMKRHGDDPRPRRRPIRRRNSCQPIINWLTEGSTSRPGFAAFLTENCREMAPRAVICSSRKVLAPLR